MNSYFVAIEIIHNNVILTPDNKILIMFWDGSNNIIKTLANDEQFKQLIINNCNTQDKFFNSKIVCTIVNISDETTENKSFGVQDIISLDMCESLMKDIIKTEINNLHKYVFNVDFKFNNESYENNVIRAYNQIKSKYKNNLNANTFIHYIVSKIKNNYSNINAKNQKLIQDKLINIL